MNVFQHLIPNAIHSHEGMSQLIIIVLVLQGGSPEPILNVIDTLRPGIEPATS